MSLGGLPRGRVRRVRSRGGTLRWVHLLPCIPFLPPLWPHYSSLGELLVLGFVFPMPTSREATPGSTAQLTTTGPHPGDDAPVHPLPPPRPPQRHRQRRGGEARPGGPCRTRQRRGRGLLLPQLGRGMRAPAPLADTLPPSHPPCHHGTHIRAQKTKRTPEKQERP